jgi:hypothetical protein
VHARSRHRVAGVQSAFGCCEPHAGDIAIMRLHRDAYRRFSEDSADAVVRASGRAILLVAFFGLVLWFQPGWADGWPGASKHVVWAGGMAGIAFVMFVLFGTSAFTVPCLYLQRAAERDYLGWRAFGAMTAVWSLLGLALACIAFLALRSEIAREWP